MNTALAFVLSALCGVFIVAAVVGIINIPPTSSKEFKCAVEIIDGCEYFRFFSGNNYEAITHKGNCKNHEQ